jgi:hypothetical protein
MQMGIVPIVRVGQEGCAAENPQNQDRNQHSREQTTGPLRPNKSVQGRAALDGSTFRHRHAVYRSAHLPSMTDSESLHGRNNIIGTYST